MNCINSDMLTLGTALVRNRKPGGVGGRRKQFRLLPDAEDYYCMYALQFSVADHNINHIKLL